MTHTIASLQDLAGKIADIVGRDRVLTDESILAGYGQDTSHGPMKKPDVVARVLSTSEVQGIVRLANECRVPVVPRSSEVGFYGAGVPEQGGIVIDMSGMKKIRRIDLKNRWALFEAGVTYGQMQFDLARQQMTALLPLAPHPQKSVITSCLEREPRLTPKHHLDETIVTMEMVLPTGGLFHTGSMAVSQEPPETIPDVTHCDLCNALGPGLDWYRLIPGSLGTYGIVTVMNVRIAHLPVQRKLLFLGFKNLQDCVEPWYHMLRRQIGDECLLLNNRYLALLLADSADEIEGLQAALPAYTLALNITAGQWRPEEKMAYQEKAVHDVCRTFHVQSSEQLPYVPEAGARLTQLLQQPSDRGPYWKWLGKGAAKEVFFLTTLQRAPEFLRIIYSVAAANGYPASAVGLYLQPKQNGRAVYMEAGFAYDPDIAAERERAETVHRDLSCALVDAGAFFYRIYGHWAELVYGRTGNLHPTLKRIKRTLDPANVLNPGKLGF